MIKPDGCFYTGIFCQTLGKPGMTAPSSLLACFYIYMSSSALCSVQSSRSWGHKYRKLLCVLWKLGVQVLSAGDCSSVVDVEEGRGFTLWGRASSSGTLASLGEGGGAGGSRPWLSRRWTTAGQSEYRSWWYGQPDPSTHLRRRHIRFRQLPDCRVNNVVHTWCCTELGASIHLWIIVMR